MKLDERDYWLGFNACGGFGPKRFGLVLKYFGSAQKAWLADKIEWQKINLPKNLIDRFCNFKSYFDIVSYKLRLEKLLVKFITYNDENYPIILKKIDNPAYLIYLKGELLPQDCLAVCLVGTRKISAYGRLATRKITSDLVSNKVTIVSGLARGVDSLAHRTALEFGGRTLAVVGHGLDIIYPPENKSLAEEIIKNGAVISQFPLGVLSLPGNFPARNKIIAGLSLATVVIEGSADSGSLITATYSETFSRPVFAVPGPITSEMSAAPFKLLKGGGKIVTCGEDILQELKIKNCELGINKKYKNKNDIKIQFNNDIERKIWESLADGIKHIDQIIRLTKISPAEVLSVLTEMELSGKITNLGNGEYCL
jgi:DNA processing protein